MNFKVGQRVKCIEPFGALTLVKDVVYTIIDAETNFIWVNTTYESYSGPWDKDRFILVETNSNAPVCLD
jgi:hypothetical protein